MVVAGFAFLALVALQVVFWRIRGGRGHYLALVGVAAFVFIGMTGVFAALRVGSLFDYLNAVLLYGALALAYMVTYSALQADSPTFAILREIGHAPAQGCSLEWLHLVFNNERLIVPRLDDLVAGGLADWWWPSAGERYVLTRRGALLAQLYVTYRQLLWLEKGG